MTGGVARTGSAGGAGRSVRSSDAAAAPSAGIGSDPGAGHGLLFLREEQLRQTRDLLFRAARDLGVAGEALLAERGLGRAHGRALEAIAGEPGLTVGRLLRILRITKQSLARVLATLLREGLVRQAPGIADRRERHLRLTDAGEALERSLFERQRGTLVIAFGSAGANAVDGFRRVLRALAESIDEHAENTGGSSR